MKKLVHVYQINSFLYSSTYFYTIAIGLDSILSYVSPNYGRNFSLGRGSLTGQHFSVTLHPDDIKTCEAVGLKCFEELDLLLLGTLRKRDGRGGYVTTQWEMQSILDDHGQPEGIYCNGYNITKFLDTETKLARAETHLDEISFIQSHGVRKPLANIMGISKFLCAADNDEERVALLNVLNISADELDQIIKEISGKKDLLTNG